MLNEFIKNANLRFGVLKRKQEFLICLKQCMESTLPDIYERGIMIISDMTDIDVLTQTELFALNPILPAIRCMLPKRENEDNTLVMTRQISGLNLLCKLDRFDFQWSDESSQMLLDVDTKNTNSLDPLHCLISFLEQNHQEGYKAQAAQVFGMIIEQGSLNDRLNTLGLPKILEK